MPQSGATGGGAQCALCRDAIGVVRSRHRLDWGWRQSLRRVRAQFAGIIWDGLTRIDRRVVVRIRSWLHHAIYRTPLTRR
jgi:hypothetical protein